MTAFSQIVELNASPDFHNLGRVIFADSRQIVKMDDNKNGGPNYLKAWRKYRRLTLEELAEKLETAPSVLSYLEQGERGLSAKWLRRLAEALETTPGMILDHDPSTLNADVIDMWAHAPASQKQQFVEIARTIFRTGTD